MCGIFFRVCENTNSLTNLNVLNILKHRGPDAQGYLSYTLNNCLIELGHTHLCINGLKGSQPFNNESMSMVVNGELYNYESIAKTLNYEIKTNSDCEVLMPLYKEYGRKMFDYINGQYSFVIVDKINNKVIIARDYVGITSLYIGYNEEKNDIAIASELKCLLGYSNINHFSPKSYMEIELIPSGLNKINIVYDIFNKKDYMLTNYVNYDNDYLKLLLETSVKDRIPKDTEVGYLLSGGD